MRLNSHRAVLCLIGSVGLAAGSAHAQSWAEIASGGINGAVDAGEFVATANVTDGSGSLTTITGSLVAGVTANNTSFFDADMFCINIVQPTAFSAVVAAGDSNLSLFSLTGAAIAFNDDTPGAGFGQPSSLTSLHTANLPAGHYFLAISR